VAKTSMKQRQIEAMCLFISNSFQFRGLDAAEG